MLVVPQPPAAVAGLERACPAKESTARSQDALVANGDTASLPPTPPVAPVAPAKMLVPAPAGPAASRPLSNRAPDRASTGRERGTPGSPAPGPSALPEVIQLTPSVLSVRHWGRIGEGLRLATSPRVDWATLLKRSLDVDALKCPKCNGRLRILAAVTNASEAKRILAHLGPPTAAPRPARARDPTDDFVDVDVESWAGGCRGGVSTDHEDPASSVTGTRESTCMRWMRTEARCGLNGVEFGGKRH